jgi:transposase
MVRPDLTKWGQSLSDLRRLLLEADHPRSRERFLALYMIAGGQTSATPWAQKTGRTKETVLSWVHQYNQAGPDGVLYRHSGGRRPLFHPSKSSDS